MYNAKGFTTRVMPDKTLTHQKLESAELSFETRASVINLSEAELSSITGGFFPGLNEIVAGFRLVYQASKLIDALLPQKTYGVVPGPYPSDFDPVWGHTWYQGTHENT
jgi:hypothetical protein